MLRLPGTGVKVGGESMASISWHREHLLDRRDASANRRQFEPPTPTHLGRGSEGLVLRLCQGGVFFE